MTVFNTISPNWANTRILHNRLCRVKLDKLSCENAGALLDDANIVHEVLCSTAHAGSGVRELFAICIPNQWAQLLHTHLLDDPFRFELLYLQNVLRLTHPIPKHVTNACM